MVSLSSFAKQFREAVDKNHSLVCFAECIVDYSGRAESHLPVGNRILILKSDNTFLVHQKDGHMPVNYMKQGASFIIRDNGKSIMVQLKHSSLKEYMNIEVGKVHSMHSQLLEDNEKIQLVGTEKDMAEHIMKNPELVSKDFKPLSLEEHTKYGFIDVFGHDKNGTLVIVECKRYGADLNAVTQLRRYVEKIKKAKGLKKVKGVIAAPKITGNAKNMLTDWGFEFKPVKPPRFLEKFDKYQRKLIP